MKLDEALLFEKIHEGTPEASIEYFRKAQYGYDKEGRGALAVRLNRLNILTTKVFKLRDFWEKQKESELIEQFIKATFGLSKKYGIADRGKKDFETYQYVVENLFSTKNKSDITFYIESGYNFKGLLKGEKFSISKIKREEKKELEKLK